MKSLKNHTVAELVERLKGLGVEWTGATTRKGPLISAILEAEADMSDEDGDRFNPDDYEDDGEYDPTHYDENGKYLPEHERHTYDD